jgi:hypothetical protein
MSDDQLAAALDDIRVRVFTGSFPDDDSPRLLRAVDAVLKLADELEATPYPDATAIQDCEVIRTDLARGLGRIFRAAITAALTKGEATP